jgi:hypothetical protein
MNWSLPHLLLGLHDDIQHQLTIIRRSIGHPTAKGDGSERVWIDLLNTYLPSRYCATTAHVVDSESNFSDQIDVVVYDRQYCPLVFKMPTTTVIPAESVYAVFESKQEISNAHVVYAQEKAASVRKLHRTSLPIPHAGGRYDPKPLHRIIAGILTLDSVWTPPLGAACMAALNDRTGDDQLDIGCVASHGYLVFDPDKGNYEVVADGKHATAFLLRLISLLQACATVPMIDVQAYARWLNG